MVTIIKATKLIILTAATTVTMLSKEIILTMAKE
jgi:hypothetical protein